MSYKVKDSEECLNLLRESLHTLLYLRHWSKEWHEHYGAERKGLKEHWEKKADKMIERLGLEYKGSHPDPNLITTDIT